MTVNLNDYCQEAACVYKDERYSVRDNGAVLKHPREGKRPRPTDNQWTFGKPNNKTGYMEITVARIHRIVATAFHGDPPTKEHVVDHIDTNKRNNRPGNLRWVTRLENVLLNPITAKRIAIVCGSVEAFLADPSKFRDRFPEQNYKWMSTVSIMEAQISLERMLAWAKSDKLPSGGTLDEWIFNRTPAQNPPVIARTPGAVQRDWELPAEFPCCPQNVGEDSIAVYTENLKTGRVFCRSDQYTSLVSTSAMSEDHQSLYVMAESSEGENAIKPWKLAKITYEDGLIVHTNLGSYFTKNGALKQLTIAQGLEWTGEDTIDDQT